MLGKKSLLISISIAILLAFFIGYGIEVFAPTPEYEDFCPSDLHQIKTEQECLQAGGVWGEEQFEPRPVEVPAREFCAPPRDCYDALNQVQNRHDLIVFVTATILGIIAIIIGILFKKEIISTGIVGGGILLLLYGTLRYWRHANNILKFVILGVALAIVIWLTYKKLEKR